MTWGIWQIFTTALGSLKIRTLIGFFCPKLKMHELKIYRGVMCHDNEEWYKNYRGTDLSVQNWHEESDEFWPEHSKISKICTLMGCLWHKVCNVWAIKVQRSSVWWYWILMKDLMENWLVLSKITWEICKIFTIAQGSKLRLWWDSFIQSWKIIE